MNSGFNARTLLLLLTLCNELKCYVLHFNTDRMGEHLSTRRLPTPVESKQQEHQYAAEMQRSVG